MNVNQNDFAERAANILLDIGAVNWNFETPFILTSGAASPVYVDCRSLISFVDERREIVRMLAVMLAPVNFDALYQQALHQAAALEETATH